MSLTWTFTKSKLTFMYDNGTRVTNWHIDVADDSDTILKKLQDIVNVASPVEVPRPNLGYVAPSRGIPLPPDAPKTDGVSWDSGNVDDLPIYG